MCGHFLGEGDGRRAAHNARRNAAAEPRVGVDIMILIGAETDHGLPEPAGCVSQARQISRALPSVAEKLSAGFSSKGTTIRQMVRKTVLRSRLNVLIGSPLGSSDH